MYLKPDEAFNPLHRGRMNSLASTMSLVSNQQLMFNIIQLMMTVEAGQSNTIPMLLLESKLSGDVRPILCLLEMAYYNSEFTLWELVIEPMTNRCVKYFLQRGFL